MFYSLFQVGTSQGSVCTLADSTLTKKSSIMVCDSFQVNILLVSPDKKWIVAGTKDNNDLSPKVFLVVFDSSTFSALCVFHYSITFVLLTYRYL